MSLKKLLPVLLILFTLGTLRAQELIAGGEFATRFDNREYSGNTFDVSQTLFSARLTPYLGIEWQQKNRLIVGVEMLQHFGQHTDEGDAFLSDVKPVMYYRFRTKKVHAAAGIFTRDQLMGDYGHAIFSDSTTFYHSRMAGFMGRYISAERDNTFVEAAIDWEGMQGVDSREKFRIVTAGRYTLESGFYFGYGFSMLHFAGALNNKNVTDNMILNAHLGWTFKTKFEYDLKARFLMAPQRARTAKPGWTTPCGAEIDFSISRWGLKLENELYMGENLQPYLDIVSNPDTGATFRQEGLYAGERFYSTTEHIYNRTWLGYTQSFFKNTVSVDAGILFHYDGTGLGTSQQVRLSVSLERLFRIGGHSKKADI